MSSRPGDDLRKYTYLYKKKNKTIKKQHEMQNLTVTATINVTQIFFLLLHLHKYLQHISKVSPKRKVTATNVVCPKLLHFVYVYEPTHTHTHTHTNKDAYLCLVLT